MRLLGESLHLVQALVSPDCLLCVGLDVTVTRLRTVRPDAESEKGIILRGKPVCFIHHIPELILLCNEVIRGCHGYHCIRILGHNPEDSVGDARGSVAPQRLGQDMTGIYPELTDNRLTAVFVGHHINILRRTDTAEPAIGHLDQGLPRTKNIKELLGLLLPAEWPEPASDTAGHD